MAGQIKIDIDGMSCGGCASKITSALQRDARVSSAVIDFATNTGVVEGDISRDDVTKIVESVGYHIRAERDETSDVSSQSIRVLSPDIKNLWIAGLLALPVVVMAMGPWADVQRSIDRPFDHPSFDLKSLDPLTLWEAALTTLFLVWPARGFFTRAIKQMTKGFVTMDSLVAVGMLSAWFVSVIMMNVGHGHLYFETAVMIGFFVLLGKALEDMARRKSIGEVDRLVRLRPRRVFIVKPGESPVEMNAETISVGDVLYVRPGDMVAFDGVITEGSFGFDESVVTGESVPVVHGAGERVPSGAVNASSLGALIKVDRIGQDTTIEKIISLIEDARLSRPAIQKFADKVSAVFVPVVMSLSVGTTLVLWLMGAQVTDAVMRGLSVMVVACPCALGLATPVAWVAGLGRAARAGVLVRSYESLELLRRADAIVFDKTGTLTFGKPTVVRLHAISDAPQNAMLMTLSALSHSSHPLSRALALWIKANHDVTNSPLSKLLEDVPGAGFRCEIKSSGSELVTIGRPDFVGSDIPEAWQVAISSGRPIVAVSIDRSPIYLFELEDALRPDVEGSLKRMHQRGISIYIASGDRASVVREVTDQYKMVTEARGDMTPSDKKNWVESLRTSGKTVAFVGDGINDAPALAGADIGIALGTGTDVAAHSAGLVVQKSGISAITDAMDLSVSITRIIRENFFWAFFYNVAAIPVAMAGIVTPIWAAAAMALSSLSVVLNAMRLRQQ